MNRVQLIEALKVYDSHSPEEKVFKNEFLELLRHKDAFQRYHLPGHLTGSAWIVDHSKNFVLLTHHAKLNKWLQPGGHADGNENILEVAMQEVKEETGIKNRALFYDGIFDIDIHTIPARNEVPEHLHYDVRFLVQADQNEPLILTKESHALAWVPIDQVAFLTNENTSMIRMTDKVSLLP